MKTLFDRPLIMGASISADMNSTSPGKRLALRHTDAKQIKTVARNGQFGKTTVQQVSPTLLKDRTAIIAIDLFFWDSTQMNITASLTALNHLVDQAIALDIPIILGEIPELIPGRQPSQSRLNAAIHAQQKRYDKCLIMPFEELYQQVITQGYLEFHGKRLELFDLIPDGLHLSNTAGEFLADAMGSLIQRGLPQ